MYAAALGAQGLFMMLGGLIEKIVGLRRTLLFGCILLVSALLLASQAQSLTSLLFSYGLCFGASIGILYSAPIICSVRWWPNHKAFVTGLIVCGFGGGSFIFGFLATWLSNPVWTWFFFLSLINLAYYSSYSVQDGLDVDESGYFDSNSPVVENVPRMFVVLGITYGICVLIAIILIEEPPRDPIEKCGGESPYIEHYKPCNNDYNVVEQNIQSFNDEEHSPTPVRELNVYQLMSSSLGWHLCSCFCMTAVGGML